MDMKLKKSFTWQIDNFSENTGFLKSDPFTIDDTEWQLEVAPKGCGGRDYLLPSLCVIDHKSYKLGWERKVKSCLVLLNQSGKELYRSSDSIKLFCAKFLGWGVNTLLLTKIQEKGFLENNKLTIEIYMKVLEVVHHRNSIDSEMIYFNGFNIKFSQVRSVTNIFAQHPNLVENFKPKNQEVKTAYMNLLLSLIEILNKSSQNLFGTELSNAQSKLGELTEAGFNLDWLKSKFEKISLEREKAISDGSWVQQLEERVNIISEIKMEVQQLEEHVKSLSQIKKEVQQLEERVNGL